MIPYGRTFDIGVGCRIEWMREAAAPRIPSEVRRDLIQRVSAMLFAFVRSIGAEKPVIGFLKKIVGELPVAGDTSKICPDATCRSFVECSKSFFIHDEGWSRIVQGIDAPEVGKCRVGKHRGAFILGGSLAAVAQPRFQAILAFAKS